ncbi:MAG TPA: hypothetical protein VJT49_26050 [Amycolatopsis sp.]|uniref:hypothetical protein n=1 Tax=Amycolatopsis sp. TaxID=37632 RepID=UPI002B491C3E|nr:hypothetical protein [Amycolatopsis sp.]HKS48511.1 hypothetical protein [Amycolatopsis sp.]
MGWQLYQGSSARKSFAALGFLLMGAGLVTGAFTGTGDGYSFVVIWVSLVGLGLGFALPSYDVQLDYVIVSTHRVSALITYFQNEDSGCVRTSSMCAASGWVKAPTRVLSRPDSRRSGCLLGGVAAERTHERRPTSPVDLGDNTGMRQLPLVVTGAL